MRKIYLSALLIVVAVGLSFAQNSNNHWQLGVTDLNFNTNPPSVSSVANSGNYGLASYSDSNGNLLLYTDGHKVWNKNHGIMTNGTLTNYGQINNVVIIPNPSNVNQYYIFKSESLACLCLNKIESIYYYYHIVEFNSTNPNGIILPINSNPPIGEDIYSKRLTTNGLNPISNVLSFGAMVVTKNNTNNGYWLITQNQDQICSFKIDINGLNTTPVVSQFTSSQIFNYGILNTTNGSIFGLEGADFRISNDNTKLIGLKYASITNSNDQDIDPALGTCYFYKLDFNSQTGAFTNYSSLFNATLVTSFELSSNSNYVYFISYPRPYPNLLVSNGEVTVKDITNLTITPRILKLDNTNVLSTNFSFLQKDKYQNLFISSKYSASNRNLYIHKVENQDIFSTSSVATNQISLNNSPISLKFPQLLPELNICQANKTITLPVTATQDFRVSILITASSAISNNLIVNYRANQVLLKSGFTVSGNTTGKFRAYVDPCVPGSAGRMGSPIQKDMANENLTNDQGIIRVFPNPTDGIFKIALNSSLVGNVQITNLLGSTVYDNNFKNQNELEVNIENQPAGIYIVTVISGDQKFVEKVVKN
jgi:Secretion system C-terminal sorting domain